MQAMRLLALETSTDLGSCALWQDGHLLHRLCPAGRPHSETLLDLVREILAEAECGFGNLDGIAFGAGPGAFTGLRVACGITQGLAVAHDTPVFPVVTLEAMAWQCKAPKVISLLDARMNEVYTACYTFTDFCLSLQGDIHVLPPELISLPEGDYLACGNALKAYPVLAERLNQRGLSQMPDIMPLASSVAELALPRLVKGEGLDAALAAPLYIRDKVAQTVAERLAQGGKA